MPITYRYDEFANRLLTRCEGVVALTDVIEHFRQLMRDARLRPNCDVLIDLSFMANMPSTEQVSEGAMALEEMRELVSLGRCAVVAAEDLTYGLGRMFQGFSWPLFTGMRVFRTHAGAIGWLSEESD